MRIDITFARLMMCLLVCFIGQTFSKSIGPQKNHKPACQPSGVFLVHVADKRAWRSIEIQEPTASTRQQVLHD